MKLISLISDYGASDFHVALIKGKLLAEVPQIKLLEISHEIAPFNLQEAAYIIRNTYNHLPIGSVHLLAVGVQSYERFLIIEHANHYFIAPDNGVITLIFPEVDLQNSAYCIKETMGATSNFPVLDYFLPFAISLINDVSIDLLGKKVSSINCITTVKPSVKSNSITGNIIYIDSFGNLVTNIRRDFLFEWAQGKTLTFYVRNDRFTKVYESYSELVNNPEMENYYHGRGMVLFNYFGYLEIAIYKSNPKSYGSARTLYNLDYGDRILVEKECP